MLRISGRRRVRHQNLSHKRDSPCCDIPPKPQKNFTNSLQVSEIFPIFAPWNDIFMRTAKEYIDLISAHADELRSQFGIRSLRLFGSVSRGEQREDSDVDICVDMEPSLYLLVRLKRFLEQLLQCTVDVVRMHKHINPYLLENIERDGIYVIRWP